MAFSTVSAGASAFATSASISFVLTGTLQAGDFVEVGFYLQVSKTFLSVPSGMSVETGAGSLAYPAGAASGYVGYKYSGYWDGVSTTLTFTWSGSTGHAGGFLVTRGVNATTAFDAATVSAVGSSTSIAAPSQTTFTPGSRHSWMALHWNGAGGSETATSGFTIDYILAGRSPVIQTGVQAVAGGSGAKALTTATTPWVVWMSALRPAGAATISIPAASATAAAAAPTIAAAVGVPTGLTVTGNGPGSLGVTFTGITGVDGYQIRYKQTGLTPPSLTTQTSAPLYLARMTDATPGASTSYPYTWNGLGSKIYPIDWGVRPTHNEFTGRTLTGHDMQTPWNTDSINHGTGTLAMAIGVTYGVAKAAGAYEVGGFTSDATNLSTAFGYITADAAGAHAAVPMPFDDTDASALTTTMLDSAIAAGLIPILSAGNTHTNMDIGSDPWAGRVIRVGASDPQDDTEASFSRYGTAVKLWAPNGSTGTVPNTAGNGSDSATRTEAGTSESAFLTAGVVAKVLQANSALNFDRICEMLYTQARMVITTPNATQQPLLNGDTSPENWTTRDLSTSTTVTHGSLGSGTVWDIQVRAFKGSTYSAWSSTQSATAGQPATVSVPAATLTEAAQAPVVSAAAQVAAPTTSTSSAAPAPSVSSAAIIAPPAAQVSSAAGPAPASGAVTVAPAAATLTAIAPTPTVTGLQAAAVSVPAATLTAAAVAPNVQASNVATIATPPATLTALALPPTVTTGASVVVSVPVSTVSATALPIVATIAVTVAVPASAASISAGAATPSVPASVAAPAANAAAIAGPVTATAAAVVLTVVALAVMRAWPAFPPIATVDWTTLGGSVGANQYSGTITGTRSGGTISPSRWGGTL